MPKSKEITRKLKKNIKKTKKKFNFRKLSGGAAKIVNFKDINYIEYFTNNLYIGIYILELIYILENNPDLLKVLNTNLKTEQKSKFFFTLNKTKKKTNQDITREKLVILNKKYDIIISNNETISLNYDEIIEEIKKLYSLNTSFIKNQIKLDKKNIEKYKNILQILEEILSYLPNIFNSLKILTDLGQLLIEDSLNDLIDYIKNNKTIEDYFELTEIIELQSNIKNLNLNKFTKNNQQLKQIAIDNLDKYLEEKSGKHVIKDNLNTFIKTKFCLSFCDYKIILLYIFINKLLPDEYNNDLIDKIKIPYNKSTQSAQSTQQVKVKISQNKEFMEYVKKLIREVFKLNETYKFGNITTCSDKTLSDYLSSIQICDGKEINNKNMYKKLFNVETDKDYDQIVTNICKIFKDKGDLQDGITSEDINNPYIFKPIIYEPEYEIPYIAPSITIRKGEGSRGEGIYEKPNTFAALNDSSSNI